MKININVCTVWYTSGQMNEEMRKEKTTMLTGMSWCVVCASFLASTQSNWRRRFPRTLICISLFLSFCRDNERPFSAGTISFDGWQAIDAMAAMTVDVSELPDCVRKRRLHSCYQNAASTCSGCGRSENFLHCAEPSSLTSSAATEANEFHQAMCKLNSYFTITPNVIAERSHFRKRGQEPDRTSMITLQLYAI